MKPGPKVLIVDDNRSNRIALRAILKGVHAELQEADNGFDALSLSLEQDYAMILLDVQMPEMDGYEVCEHLRSNPRTANTPVIFLTAAYKEDVDKVRGYVTGATDYLAKPIEDHILKAKIEVFLKLYNQNQLLQESESRTRAIIDTALDAVIGMDVRGRITDWNRRAESTFGWTRAEALGLALADMIIPASKREAYRRDLERFIATGEGRLFNRRIETTALRRNGEEFPVELAITPLKYGDTHHFTAFVADISVRKQLEDEVRQLAFYDPLTKLPNRRLLGDRLVQARAACRRSACHGAVMFLDLDNFKPLNDSHGHDAGDLLLIEAVGRMKRCMREMDTVARFGGDEFVMIISELEADRDGSLRQAGIVAEKIRATLAEPYRLALRREGKADAMVEHHCTASIGVALFVHSDASQEDIFRRADAAMYLAKQAGRNSIRFDTGDT